MNQSAATLGGLNCQVIDTVSAGQTPEIVVVLCHGFGAPATDLIPIGPELIHANPALAGRSRFIFPAAPLSLDEVGISGGRAWWPIDLEWFQKEVERGGFREMRQMLPPELSAAREMLMMLVDEVRRETHLPMSRIVLGGFSQGSMTCLDAALHFDDAPAALLIWSGSLLCETAWRERTSNLRNLPVLQSHGRQDPLFPLDTAECLRDFLIEAGADVEFVDFPGGHTIPAQAITRTAALLERLLPE